MSTLAAPPMVPGPRRWHELCFLLAERTWLARWRARLGDVFAIRLWIFDPMLVVVSDPAEVKRIFTAPPERLHAGEGNRVLEPLVGPHSLLMLDEREHLNRRRLLLPPFHGERMRVYGELMRAIADEEIDRWPLDRAFAVQSSMQAITLRVILRAVFGIEEGERLGELERLLTPALDAGQLALMVPLLRRRLFGLSPWARSERLRERIDEILYDEIARRRGDPELERREDVLSMLVGARDEAGEGLSDEQLHDELVTLLVAGHETTATTLSWAVERLARHPSVVARLRRELADGEEGYLDCVIKEVQRVRPVLTFAMRRLTEPMEVGGHLAPAGATLGSSIGLIHRRADIYPDPEAFRPERFEESAAETYTWLPFGGGVRRCLGASFASYELKVVLRAIVERCELRPSGRGDERARRRAITFVPHRGGRVVLESRRPAPRREPAGPPQLRPAVA